MSDLPESLIPEDNQPGHHPEVEQDRPTEPPALWRLHHGEPHTVPYRFEGWVGLAARAFGVRPDRDGLRLGGGLVVITYGPWRLETELDNVASVAVTGPYAMVKVIGPPHLSLADRGISFATNDRAGVCLRFHEPVPAALPWDGLRHPGATVTIDDPERVEALLVDHLVAS
ncbi:MAG TPA: hypothetical protein VJM33_02620 [Microthrixaceae bacterium]|nr:hypothetical protein [Microthrixaceae bacterium]